MVVVGPQCVGEFEKVSYEQFASAIKAQFGTESEETIRGWYDNLKLPTQATGGSAGNDFVSPFSFTLAPGASITIPTGIRVRIDPGWWLGCFPRSGLGCKFRMQLDNTVGVIDSDYYKSDNEGHIFAKVTNDSHDDKVLTINQGDRFMQAILIPYGIPYGAKVTTTRNGGHGSTGK